MDDNVSIKSSDSLTTSGEYEIVSETSPIIIMEDIKKLSLTSQINNSDNQKELTTKLSKINKKYQHNNFNEINKIKKNEIVNDEDDEDEEEIVGDIDDIDDEDVDDDDYDDDDDVDSTNFIRNSICKRKKKNLQKISNSSKSKSKSPTLNIANNGDYLALKNDMTEVIKELDKEDKPVKHPTNHLTLPIPSSSSLSCSSFLNVHHQQKQQQQQYQKQQINQQQTTKLLLSSSNSSTNNFEISPSSLINIPMTTTKSIAASTLNETLEINSSDKNNYNSNKASPYSSDLLSPKSDFSTPDINKVGQSIFYDCIDLSPTSLTAGEYHFDINRGNIGDGNRCNVGAKGNNSSDVCYLDEKQDDMKPEKNSDTDEEISDIDQGCTIFSGVTFLGSIKINSPKSESEIQKNISELNNGTNSAGFKVSVSIPTNYEGFIILYDAEKDNHSVVVQSFEVQRILFYARGPPSTNEQACFAFTCSHGDSQESTIFQCYVFRCSIPEAVNQVSSCFAKAFQRYPPSLTGSVTSAIDSSNVLCSVTSDISGNPLLTAGYEFIVSLEIREKVAKSSYSSVPRDKSCFKLRCNTDKEVCIIVKQTPTTILQPLYIERCFGVLLSPGKLVRQADMQLLDMVSMGYQKPFNNETLSQNLWPYRICAEWKANDKAFEQLNYESQKMFLTVAVDLVIKGITEPVRFVIETPVTIQSQSEIRIMDHFISRRPMSLRFYLQLKKTDDGNWEVSSIDPYEEVVESSATSSSILKQFNNLSKMVRSSSTVSIDDSPTYYSSDGDEPLLSGTGEVSKDCSQDILAEWDPVLREWTENIKRPKNLASLVRDGIPEALRGTIWQKLANAENKTDLIDGYRTLITKETKCEAVIMRDIHRTFPAHKFFKETGGLGQDSLFKVSKAYAVYDTEVGYCQGLSFIAASLLLHMPEEDAFCVLVSLMYDYGLRDLYKQGFESLYMRLSQLNRLIKEHLPKLYEHFERMGIETHMFASQWFLTLFTARFPLCFVFHVLDVFLLDGIPILFQVAITLLSICENELRQLDFEGILKFFRVTLAKKCRSANQANKIIRTACERKFKKLKQYEEEFIQKKNAERIEREKHSNELKLNEERKKMRSEILHLQQCIEQANEKVMQEEKKHTNIVQDYKQIIQRQEQEITKLNEMLEDITKTIAKCQKCSKNIESNSSVNKTFGKLLQSSINCSDDTNKDPLNDALQRIRELELELAQTKLAQVEAECKNQDLNHQLNTTLTEIQSNRNNSWQPWLSKTINSIQEKVTTKKDNSINIPTFQSYMLTSPSLINSENQNQDQNNIRELSPKKQNKNRINRNSIDMKLLPHQQQQQQQQQLSNEHTSTILQETLNFSSMK